MVFASRKVPVRTNCCAAKVHTNASQNEIHPLFPRSIEKRGKQESFVFVVVVNGEIAFVFTSVAISLV